MRMGKQCTKHFFVQGKVKYDGVQMLSLPNVRGNLFNKYAALPDGGVTRL